MAHRQHVARVVAGAGHEVAHPASSHSRMGVPIDPKYTQTEWCGDKAIQFIRQERGYRSWLMSVNIFQPHSPFLPTEEYFKRYDPAKMPSPKYRNRELETKSPYARTDHQAAYGGRDLSFAETDDLTHRTITAAYYAMIEQMDQAVGRVLDALEKTGQHQNTIVIYSSDHGEMLGDHGIYLKG
ncbi:MAG TPA: sulfatase-like hydrolase/transferase, partial [Bryobacteraceae bacterium]|nr:sulfatase-like hydrolase/transferase [Bryobacteraceae bacterium]